MAALLEPLLATMSVAARAAWPHIESGIGKGLSANSIQNALRDAGIGIRRQDLLALAREARAAVLIRSDLERLPRDIVVTPERVRTAITRTVAPFTYVVKVTGFDADTGEDREVTLTAHSTELRSFSEVEDSFMQADIASDSVEGFLPDEARVVDVLRSGTAGVL